jgi:hypothetical protein
VPTRPRSAPVTPVTAWCLNLRLRAAVSEPRTSGATARWN